MGLTYIVDSNLDIETDFYSLIHDPVETWWDGLESVRTWIYAARLILLTRAQDKMTP